MDLTPQQWLQKELRILYGYGEHETFQKSAQRILAGLIQFNSQPSHVTLSDTFDQVGTSAVPDSLSP